MAGAFAAGRRSMPPVLTRTVARVRAVPPIGYPIVAALLLALLPGAGLDAYWQRELMLIAIYGLVVLGLNVSHGYAGELALGQAAVFGSGAYVTGILAQHGVTDLLVGLLAGGLTATTVGVVVGIPGVRLGAWSLAMISFFLVILFPDVIGKFPHLTGGQLGLVGIPAPTLFGHTLGAEQLYVAVVLTAVGWLIITASYVRSRHGDALRVLSSSPVLAQSLGMSVSRTKIVAYAIGAAPAGIAGTLFAYLQQYLSATAFDLNLTLAFLAASVIGGSQGMAGAFVGAAVLEIGPMQSTSFQQYSTLTYGLLMLVGGLFLAGGLQVSWLRARDQLRRLSRNRNRTGSPPVPSVEHRDPAARAAALQSLTVEGQHLRVEGVSKAFGAQQVLRDVAFEARPGEVTAIIGPNGSGKTTLLNTVSGFVRPDHGTIRLGDRDLVGLPAHRVARAGVSRSFQTPNVPSGLTSAQVAATARFCRPYVGSISSALRLPRYRHAVRADRRAAALALDALGLSRHADLLGAALPLGTRRLLEVARSVTASPALLLLDEPASGLDEQAIEELANAILAMRDVGATVVLIEHNFPLVLRIADRINVLAVGRIVAAGTPEEIRRHPEVLRSYLGSAAVEDEIVDDHAVETRPTKTASR